MIKFSKITLTLAALSDLAVVGINGGILWGTLVIFFTAWSFTNPQFVEFQETNPIFGVDYVKYMSQADMAIHQPDKLYDLEAQTKWMAAHVSAERFKSVKDLNPSYYPPPFCLASVPFLSLTYAQGLIVWSTLQVLLLATAVFVIVRKTPLEWIYFWIIVLDGLASKHTIVFGQTSFLMSSLVAGMYYCWLKNKQLPAGVLLALAAMVKPHHCLVPFVMILAKRQWKTFITFGLTLLALFGVSASIMGLPVVLGYPAALHKIEQDSYNQLYNAPLEVCVNIRGIVGYVLNGDQARLVGNVALLLGIIGCYWIWRQSIKKGPQSYPLAMVITTSFALACNLHANFYDLTLLILPCALATEAVGFYYSLTREQVQHRLWCLSFPLFWLISLVHTAAYRPAVNWHLAYLLLYAVWSFWFWCKIPTGAASASGLQQE